MVASYSPTPVVSRSLATLVSEFEAAAYRVVVVRASESSEPLIWPDGFDGAPHVVIKPNIGYDFGSWATGMKLFPHLLSARFVILANDSMIGPFASLAPMVENFENSGVDVWGATNTTQFIPHLQSYMLGFSNGILQDSPLQHFWTRLRRARDKQQIIELYEMGFSRLLYAEGYVTGAWFDYERVVEPGQNPAITGWKKLIDLGFPFVKRELVTNPAIVTDGYRVPDAVSARFGVDPRTWL
ncbi:hypothetical protein ITJ38_02770 [Agreia pratensis]|nr:hypothetical protein [Agreia pratensis]